MRTDHSTPSIPIGLADAIRSFPVVREVEHCGRRFRIGSLEFYADCPECGARIKLRGFTGEDEIEDVIDAVLEWMLNPEAKEIAAIRQTAIAEDIE